LFHTHPKKDDLNYYFHTKRGEPNNSLEYSRLPFFKTLNLDHFIKHLSTVFYQTFLLSATYINYLIETY